MKKTLWLLPIMLAAFAPAASAQEVCTNAYSACIGMCVKDKSPALQDRCIEVCQSNNTACYAKHNGLVQQQEEPSMERPADALAAEEPAPPMPRKKPAPRKSERRPAPAR